MRLAITGSNGFIGSNLTKRLDRLDIPYIRIPHTASMSTIIELLKDFRADGLVHLASVFIAEHKPDDLDLLVDSNVGFGVRVLEACRIAGVNRVVITGSSWQHFGNDSENPVNLYGALKNGLESCARYYASGAGLSIAFLKLYDSYGAGDPRPKLVPHLLNLRKAVRSGESKALDLSEGEQIVDFTFVENTIDAILRAFDWTVSHPKQFESFRVTGGEPLPLRQFVALFEKLGDVKLNVNWGAKPYRAREVMNPWQEAPELPGYKAKVSLAEGLRKLFED